MNDWPNDVGGSVPDVGDVLLRIADMSEARLVLTDALVTESLRRGKAAERDANEEHPRSRGPKNVRRPTPNERVGAQSEEE